MLSVGRATAQAQAGIIPLSCQAAFHGKRTKCVIAPLPSKSREEGPADMRAGIGGGEGRMT